MRSEAKSSAAVAAMLSVETWSRVRTGAKKDHK